MGVTQPPKVQRTTRNLARFLFLVVLLILAGAAIWHVTTQGHIDLVEDGSVASLNVDPNSLISVEDVRLRVVQHSDGNTPLVLLHDVDIGGSVVMSVLAEATSDFRTLTIDLPGFGLSTRFPEAGEFHTVGNMAETVSGALEQLFTRPVVIAGVGLGGKVAADLAVRHPELVSGLVMVDVDFWARDSWRERSQRLPIIGNSMTYTYETAGRFAMSTWSPHCGETGGWCPTAQQRVDRDAAATLAGSTASVHGFRNTPQASLVPSDLDQISVPTAYVWSLQGPVPRESVERIKEAIPEMSITDVDTWAAHLEAPDRVADAIRSVSG